MLLSSYLCGTTLVKEVDAAYAGNPRAKAIVAEHQAALGNLDEAIRTLKTFRDDVGDVEPITSLRLGDLYYRAERFDSAAEEYESVFSLDAEDPIRTRYVVSLYNAGEWKKAFSLARELRERYGISKGLANVELFANELIGDLSSAVALLHEWIDQQPNEYYLRVWLANYYVRLGQVENAQKQLESVRPGDLTAQPAVLLKAAQMIRFLDLGSGLEFAYEAWRSAPEDPLTQVKYARFVLSIEPGSCPEVVAPASVNVGCTVTLESGSDVRHVTVIADRDPDRWPQYVTPDSSLGEKLVGKKKDDIIEWATSLAFRVRDIQTKYVHALRQVLEEFQFAFPGHSALKRFEVPDKGDPNAIVATFATPIEQRHAYVEQWLQMYRGRTMPLGAVASGTGVSLPDLWHSLTMMPKEQIYAATGSSEEALNEATALQAATAVAMGYTSLLTFARLKLLSRIADAFERVIVVQDVLDDVVTQLIRHKLEPNKEGYIAKGADGLYRFEQEPTELREERESILEAVRDFIKEHCEIVPARTALDMNRHEYLKHQETLGPGVAASGLVASELTVPLCVDDWVVRVLVLKEWSVSSVCTQGVLVELKRRDRLTEEEYSRAINDLLRAGYAVVRTSVQDILWLIRDSNLALTHDVVTNLQVLNAPNCDLPSAVDVSVGVIVEAVGRRFPPRLIYHLLDALVSAVRVGRNAPIAISAIRQRLATSLPRKSDWYRQLDKSLTTWEFVYRELGKGGTFLQ